MIQSINPLTSFINTGRSFITIPVAGPTWGHPPIACAGSARSTTGIGQYNEITKVTAQTDAIVLVHAARSKKPLLRQRRSK
jgi:hypothetical protein